MSASDIWMEFVDPNGKPYYYNKTTKVSQWNKPEALNPIPSNDIDWKEYVHSNGKFYYYNSVTNQTSWTKPAVYIPHSSSEKNAPEGKSEAMKHAKKHVPASASGEFRSVPDSFALQNRSNGNEVLEPEEAREEFLQLLHSIPNLCSTSTWEVALPLITRDRRYGAIRSLGEKEELFQLFLRQKKMKEIESSNSKKPSKADDTFMQLILECPTITAGTPWEVALTYLSDDPRFSVVQSVEEKEIIYAKALRLVFDREQQKEADEKKNAKAALSDWLKSPDNSSWMNLDCTWKSVWSHVRDDPKFAVLEEPDAFVIFSTVLREVERLAEEQDLVVRKEQELKDAKLRQAFRKLLDELAEKGTFYARSRWKDICPLVVESEAFVQLREQSASGSTSKELFYDKCAAMEERFAKDREVARALLSEHNISVENLAHRSVAEILEQLGASEQFVTMHPVNQVGTIMYFKERADEKEREKKKERKKLQDKFVIALGNCPTITGTSTLEDARAVLRNNPSLENLPADDVAALFNAYIEKLREQEEKERAGEIEEGEIVSEVVEVENRKRSLSTQEMSSEVKRSKHYQPSK